MGTIKGRVIDKKGLGLQQATVQILGAYLGGHTDQTGAFIIPSIPQGSYRVRAMLAGYQRRDTVNVQVSAGDTTFVTFTLYERQIEPFQAGRFTAVQQPEGGKNRPNRAPVLVRLADAPIRAGTSARLRVGATDEDGDSLRFRLARAPAFAAIETLNPGQGMAEAEIVLAPDSCSRGTHECLVEVSDGLATDVDTLRVIINSITVPVPATPVRGPVRQPPPLPLPQLATVDSAWLVGEWEWNSTSQGGKFRPEKHGPIDRGYRRRLVIRADGSVAMFQISNGRIARAVHATYRLTQGKDRSVLAFSEWLDSLPPGTVALRYGSNLLSVGRDASHGGTWDLFVRVLTQKGGARIDTAKIIQPLGGISIRRGADRDIVDMPSSMAAALRAADPAFRLWRRQDSRASVIEGGVGNVAEAPSAIAGDFDGDLIQDVALLGRSGADQVVIAVLSDNGNPRAIEVAWRRVSRGSGESESRGDPTQVRPVHLELGPRGALNPFCWGQQRAPDRDAVGIVEDGVARFDYVFHEGQFQLFAPVP
jgi:hypothetical protein